MALVQSAPPVLELRSIVQFPNFKTDHYSLSDFLDSLAHNDTTHTIRCSRHFTTGFRDDEFCQILRAVAQMRRLRSVVFVNHGDSRLRRLPLVEVARLIHTVPQLQTLVLGRYWLLTGEDEARATLARAIAHHPALQTFHYAGCGVKQQQQQQQHQPHVPLSSPTFNFNCFPNRSNNIQLYQAIAPRNDPDAIVMALTQCRTLRSVGLTHSPYCTRDYSLHALTMLLSQCEQQLRECSIVTILPHWGPLLERLHNNMHNNNNNTAGPSCCRLQRLILTTAEHQRGISLAQVVGPLGRVPLRRLSLRFWGEGGGGLALRESSAALAAALRNQPWLRLLELSEGWTLRDRSHDFDHNDNDDDCESDDSDDEQQRDALYYDVPPKVILPAGTRGAMNDTDFDVLAEALRENRNFLQIRLDVGIEAAHQGAFDRLKIQSNLNAMQRHLPLMGHHNNNDDQNRTNDAEQPLLVLLPTVASTLERLCRHEDPAFALSCWYCFLRSNPLVWCQQQK